MLNNFSELDVIKFLADLRKSGEESARGFSLEKRLSGSISLVDARGHELGHLYTSLRKIIRYDVLIEDAAETFLD
jgi:hypothetical protein